MNPTYTIIIPHYNIPDLLVRCLRSIPVREDTQVIVVDDCSPGADRYMEQYPELSRPYLEMYSTTIGGSAGRARNVGLDHAKGKWLIFADADDVFTPNLGDVLDEYANSDKDMAVFYADFLEDGTEERTKRNVFIYNTLNSFREGKSESLVRYQFPVAWSRIIRRSVVEEHHIRFQEIAFGNDVLFCAKIGFYAKKLVVDKRAIYAVTRREGSVVTQRNKEALTIRFSAHIARYNFMKAHGVCINNPVCPFCCTWANSISMYGTLRRVAIVNEMKWYEFDWNYCKFLKRKLISKLQR